MRMKGRIAVLALAIGFLAAPVLATPGMGVVATDSCSPCCPRSAEAPCESGEASCGSLATLPCCAVAPAEPALPTKRPIDAPVLQPVAHAVRFGVPTPQRTLSARAGGALAALNSALRLSVVLLI